MQPGLTIQVLPLHTQVLRIARLLRYRLVQQFTPRAVLPFPADIPFTVRHPFRRTVWLTVEPEDIRILRAIDTRQRFITFRVAIDISQGHIVVNFLQQAKTFPQKRVVTCFLTGLPPHRLTGARRRNDSASASDHYSSTRCGRECRNASGCRSGSLSVYWHNLRRRASTKGHMALWLSERSARLIQASIHALHEFSMTFFNIEYRKVLY